MKADDLHPTHLPWLPYLKNSPDNKITLINAESESHFYRPDEKKNYHSRNAIDGNYETIFALSGIN